MHEIVRFYLLLKCQRYVHLKAQIHSPTIIEILTYIYTSQIDYLMTRISNCFEMLFSNILAK